MTREEREDAIDIIQSILNKYEEDECLVTEITIGDGDIKALKMAIEALEQEPCEDVISRKSIKQKLQEHHDFFVNAYGGFSNLPQNDKSRVDEITNCIAMVVNEPPVTPQEPILDKINKMKSEIADSLEFWDYSPNNNPLARDMLESITNFWGDTKAETEV